MTKAENTPGTLYVVATPIGNLGDFTFRAVEVLRGVDWILCEDTRTSATLLGRYGIAARTGSLHRHNEAGKSDVIIGRLLRGDDIALLSDAGTPLIRDAGRRLVAAAHERGVRVSPLPGAGAALAALSCAGFDADRFVFEGFLPATASARMARLRELRREGRTMVFFEAPHRLVQALDDLAAVFGGERIACLAKEMTKVHEAVVRGRLGDVRRWLDGEAARGRGEFVLLVEGGGEPDDEMTLSAENLLHKLAQHLPPGTAAGIVAELSGLPRNRLYKRVLGDRR